MSARTIDVQTNFKLCAYDSYWYSTFKFNVHGTVHR